LARDYLIIKYINTYFDLIKYLYIFDFCYDLIRDYMIIKYADKSFKTTRIPNIRIHILKYNYNYVASKVIAKILI